ncbi:SCO family protein [Mucilaginibacter gynuensis]|uniref:SCO family protein n=1 Tax=Mucilaginibacter gynuensis TaxID=1302236 RepID=UPI0031EDA71D
MLILAVPGFLYYLLTVGGKNRYKSLPFFGPKVLAKTSHKFHGTVIPDTIFHKLPAFTLTDQEGKVITDSSFANKIFIASFFYTGCGNACDVINENVRKLAVTYQKNNMVRFVSITVDPEHDQPLMLKHYAEKFKLPASKWLFLTGDTTQVYNLAQNGFLLNAAKMPDGQFVFNDKLVLIDAEKRIRGYYPGNKIQEIARLNDEIKVLISEELRKIKAPN